MYFQTFTHVAIYAAFASAAPLSKAPVDNNFFANGGFETASAWTGSPRSGLSQGYLNDSFATTDYACKCSSVYKTSTAGANTASLRGYCVTQTINKPAGSYKFSVNVGRISHADATSSNQEAITLAVAINNGRAILQNAICDSSASRRGLCTVAARNGVPTYDYVETRFATIVGQIKVDICATWTSSITDGTRGSDWIVLDNVRAVAA
jgi:hypothetical protein